MITLVTSIHNSIKDGDDDTALNAAIQQYLDNNPRFGQTVAQWRVSNCAMLRRWGYMALGDYTEYLDGLTKIKKGSKAEGELQVANYLDDRWAVKERFPKE